MGSLLKTQSPSMPAPYIYTPPAVQTPTTVDQPTPNTEDEEKVRAVVRRTNRGIGSTIQTSFRGVLGETNSLAPQRKTLLGE